jgi:amino acid adenylation domain-containing protein/non-ribosomal peptide synthase protein (TIGR01720 family)
VAYYLADSGARVVMVQDDLSAHFPADGPAKILRLDIEDPSAAARLPERVPPQCAAYVIYTSGSTGKPKGVSIPHAALASYSLEMVHRFGLTATDRILQFAPLGFDVVVEEIFPTLAAGAAVVLHDKDLLLAPTELSRVIAENAVTGLELPAAFWNEWVYDLTASGRALPPSLRFVLVGCDKPSPERLAAWRALGGPRLLFVFGLTETTVTSTLHIFPAGSPADRPGLESLDLPIGRPVANARVYILDQELQPVPVRAVGQLFIAGAGVGRGYLGRPELTAERFVPDPFADTPGARLYRTGDLSRYRPDGAVEFLGRLDHQVKIRGFRVEPGEVEAMLREHPAVREAAVLARQDRPGEWRLAAYCVATQDAGARNGELRRFLRERLPEHMVPTFSIFLPALPLTANGKLDRQALLRIQPEILSAGLAAEGSGTPRNRAEELLARIWGQVLRLEKVGVHDNFFELGGDSILSIQVSSRAFQEGLRITPRQMFERQTIAELAAMAEWLSGIPLPETGPVTGPVPLTPIQCEFFAQDQPSPGHFNQALLLTVGAVDGERVTPSALRRAVAGLLVHHDALRMRFAPAPGDAPPWRQVNDPPGEETPFVQVDLSALPPEQRRSALEDCAARLQKSLDLTAGPLWRTALFTLSCGEPDRLLVIAHHLIVDGVSWRIVLEDLETLCHRLSLPPKTTSFQRWAERLSDYAVSTAAAAQAEAWIGRLRSIPARLPVDFSGGANDLASARAVVVSLDTEETRTLLTQVPRAYRTQINDVLLTALAEALGSWTGDRRLLVDLESHGREELFADLDLGRTVGYFTSICPLHLDLEGLESPGEALKAVKEELRSMPQRGIGFGILRHLGAAPVRERLAALPQPEVIFNYLGQLDQAVAGDRLFQPATESAGPAQDPRQRRAHRLEINGGVRNGRLSMVWTYSESFHRVATIEGVASRFLAALRELIRHCLQPGAGGVTPSDFPLGLLDQPALDRIATAVGGKIADLYPASPAQQGMLFHSLHDAGSGVYLAQMSFDLNVDLDVAAFEHAWQEVVRRHTILRSAFVWRDLLEPVQVVFEDVPLDWEHHDWRALTSTEQEERLAAHLRNDWDRPLDLARPPLMRLILIRLDEQRYRFVWDHHHLLLDGWSLPILWRELFQIYEARRRGEKIRLEPARPYRDYIAWLLQQNLAAAEELWRRTLAGFTATTPLAVDRMAATAQGSSTGVRESATSAGLLDALQGLARRRQLTINTLVQGAWALLLSRYSGERDVVFGGVTSGRSAPIPGMESMVGMFINTLPVRVQVPLAMPLLAWLRGIQEQQAEMRQYEYSPLSQVLGWSEVPRGTALFESILAFENFPRDQSLRRQAGEGLRIGAVDIEEQTNYPLNLVVAPGSRLQLRVLYQPGRLDGVTVARMMHHLEALLDGMVTGADGTLDALPILTAAERQQALLEWNDFAKECPQVPMVHELCALHARRRPEATAVASRQDRLTYGDLEARSNRLAHHLRSRGVGPDVLVALCTERTLERVVGIVSVLKAGGAYVSLDPTYPKDRLAFLLDDARALVLLTQSKLAGLLPESGAAVIQLDGDWNAIRGDETQPPVSGVTPDNLAYVVYTSGSTGKPKGVEIPHAGLMNLVRWHQDLYEVKPEDRGTQVASPAFDASIWELWPYLAAGASVHIPDEETRLSSSRMVRWWSEVGITLAYLMTPLAEGVLEEQIPPGLELATRALIIGGDRLHRGPDPAVSFRLMNHYGPAEYSVTSTVVRVPPAGQGNGIPTIGRPVDNTQIYLLDRCFNPVPIGVPGELFVAGAGLARSYLRRPDLTAEKFVPDPFSGEPGARMYRTADLVRYMPDGDMDFLGRLDHQVKIRGLRIELGEIETVLGQYPLVREAAVLVREDVPGDKRLVAYLVPAGEAPAVEELRMFLKERLPEYMVPAAFVSLPALPLTPNGKVDRRALPAPEWKEAEAYVAPRTSTEELLAGIWSEILKIDRVGVRSGFFELGGHSLLATQVISGVRKVFGVELPLRAIFESPTVGELAGVVEAALCQTGAAAVAPPLARVPRSGPSPLSFGQQRLWFLDQLQPGGSVFNVPSSYLLRGALHLTTLARAFEEVVRRHEVLRTVFFTAESGEPVQVVLPPAPLPLPLVDLTALPEAERRREQTRLNAVEGQRPFNLASGPLLRALCVRLAADEHALLIVMHHIISDGWSHSLLLQEITDLCIAYAAGRQSPLPELPLQYADFAHWQRQWLSGEVLQAELDYWRAQLRDLPGPLELPKDRPLPAHPKRRSASASLRLDRPLAERLEALARREGATLFMVLLAVLRILLYRQAGQSDLLLGTPVAGRQRSELEGLIGFFLNTLVLRIDLAAVSTFTELLARERSSALEAYAHQTVPFERILQEVQPERDLRYTPLFQMLFNMLELPEPQIGSADLTYEPLPPPEVGTAFDLTLYAGRGRQGIRLTATYDAEQFDAVRIDEMLAQLAGLIAQVVEEPDVRLDQLSLVTPAAQAVLPDPTVPLPAPACEPLARLLLAQMESLPQAPAVCQGACRWTYAELGGHAHALAHRLQRAGGAGRVVAVCGPRSPELIGALAGVVLAGGVLLTLDRKLPEQRQRLMLREAGAACLVYAGEPRHEDEWMLREPGLQVLPVPQAEVTAASAFEPAAAFPMPGPDDPAYLFFTSGTTGKPKAVLGRQKGLSHFLLWQRATFAIGPHDRSAQLTGLSFDVVLRDIFLPLISGAALCLPDDDNLGPEAVLPWLEAKAVTVLHTVPSLAAFWLERVPEEVRLAGLRWTFFAGEPLPASLIEKWRESFPQSGGIVNLYGPTETTLAKCFYRVPAPPAPGIQPAGFPLPQTQVLVLSGDRLCGIGEVGEVVLRTPFRSRGYLQAEEEGRRRFHRNPFRDDAEDLVYRTGDRGRYRPDGALDLLGRIDDQIKIRGMRVEPEEVRAVLERIPKVRACAVVAREDVPGEKRLVAYLVPEREKSLSPREVRRELESQLPDFMVPSAFVMLEALPLTPNGKLDRNALPAPGDLTVGDAERAAPRNSVEQELVRIWEELLHVQPIGVCDDFFELGGHSLLILRLRARLEESFGRTLPVADFFRHTTIEDLALALRRESEAAGVQFLVPIHPRGSLPPFYCVHPAGGDAAVYQRLAEHLGPEQPFYSFQAKGLENDEEPHRSIEDMARAYLEELRIVQPAGPYHLGGWSFGGRVAFEMALQLSDQGEPVASLILMDSGSPLAEVAERGPDGQILAILVLLAESVGLALSEEDLLPLDTEGRLARVAADLVAAGVVPDPEAARAQLIRRIKVLKATGEAGRKHHPRAYSGPITYLRAESSETSSAVAGDPSRGWSHYSLQPVTVQPVPGDHYTLIQEPYVQTLADVLREALRSKVS